MAEQDKVESSTSPEFDEVIDTPAGGLYIRHNKKETYFPQYVTNIIKKETILETLKESSDSDLSLSWGGYNVEDLHNALSTENWMEVLDTCTLNCKRDSVIRLLDKYVALSIPPYLQENYTSKDAFNTIKDCLCSKCGPKVGMIVYYMELLDTESLIRQGYLNEFLNSFIEYKNFGMQGKEMYGKYTMQNIRRYMSNHDLEVTKISGGIFNLDNFNEWLHQAKVNYFYKNNSAGSVDALNEWTTPVLYSAPDGSGGRIKYKLPNLFSYANTSLYIDKNRDKIIDYFIDNRNSISKFFENDVYDDYVKDEIKADLLIGKSKRFTVKIQDFPRSVYTHSIEWIMGGKLEAKRSLNKKSSTADAKPGYVSDLNFGNKLDLLMRVSQNGETHGIPVGTLVSRIVAEMYMCKFDEKLLSEKKLSFSREFDKITFGYDTDYELMEIKRLVHDLSNKYSLSLSEISSECGSFPFVEASYKNILNYFDSSPLCYEVDIQSKNIKNVELSIRRQIYQFIDYCVSEEGKGIEGSLEAMIPALVSSIRDGSINSLMDRVFETDEEKVESLQRILVEPNYFTDLSIFEKLLDVCVLYPRITQKYIDFSQFMVDLAAADTSYKNWGLKKSIRESVAKYFSKAFENLSSRIGDILDQGHSQELHSLLNLFIVFDYDKNHMSNLEVKEICKAIISSGIDDINMILATMVYYRKFDCFDDILEDSAKILWRSHYITCGESDSEYVEDKNWHKKLCSCGKEFSGEFWMYRYFMYSLNSERMFSGDESIVDIKYTPQYGYGYGYEYEDEGEDEYGGGYYFMRRNIWNDLSYGKGEEESQESGIYSSFQESLNRVRSNSKVLLRNHFKFRLTKKEVESRLKNKNERRGMIVHKFYREMLDSGVRITGKGNKDLDSGTYGFMYGLSK